MTELRTCFGEDETIDHVDEPDLFGEGDEGAGGQQSPQRVLPTHERFEADELIGLEIDDGLVVDDEFFAGRRAP